MEAQACPDPVHTPSFVCASKPSQFAVYTFAPSTHKYLRVPFTQVYWVDLLDFHFAEWASLCVSLAGRFALHNLGGKSSKRKSDFCGKKLKLLAPLLLTFPLNEAIIAFCNRVWFSLAISRAAAAGASQKLISGNLVIASLPLALFETLCFSLHHWHAEFLYTILMNVYFGVTTQTDLMRHYNYFYFHKIACN